MAAASSVTVRLQVRVQLRARVRARIVCWLFKYTTLLDRPGAVARERRRLLRGVRWRVVGSQLGWVNLYSDSELVSL